MRIANERLDAFQRATSILRNDNDWVAEVVPERIVWRQEIVKFGVNWSCRGTKPADEAKIAGAQLVICAEIAEALNGLEIKVDRENDDYKITNWETYVEETNKVIRAIKAGNVKWIVDWFNAGDME